LGFVNANAQTIEDDASRILLKMNKLNILGSALYLAAHPDDENTRLIAYLGNERLVSTAYLAITRGDGGQNLIGPELREGLGVIRTQELLAARRLDGGQQFFTRANDFGYSKTADETLKIWDKDKVLSDVVWVIRKFRPDVIITRFPPDARAGHGHHTSSAILAEEAFKIAGTNAYPGQLTLVKKWQPTRIAINSGRWWDKDIEKRAGVIKVDAGAFNPLLGLSFGEIAAESRSMHKSQGFGVSRVRGEQMEYMTVVDGLASSDDLFSGIDLSWKRVGKSAITLKVNRLISSFDPMHPEASVKELFSVRDAIAQVADDYWRKKKLAEVDELIMECSGLFTGSWAQDYTVVPGEKLKTNLELVNRSDLPWQLVKIKFISMDSSLNLNLADNKRNILNLSQQVSPDRDYSGPYWLKEPHTLGMYTVKSQKMRGLAQNPPAFTVRITLALENHTLERTIPVIYRWTDRVNGEMHRPLTVTPPVFTNFNTPVNIFTTKAKQLQVVVMAGKSNVKGSLTLTAPPEWKISPDRVDISLEHKWDEQLVTFTAIPPAHDESASIIAKFRLGDKDYNYSIKEIKYTHIPYQVLLPKAEIKAEKITIHSAATTVGYIMGAGDAVPEALEQLGIEVRMLGQADITKKNLQNLDAVVLGIRAVNTLEWLPAKKDILLSYVKEGGTLVTQYNTTRRINWEQFAPYPLAFTGRSADSRIAEETAKIHVLLPNHTVMNFPNTIVEKDFDGWVQERGLYFPSSWDSHYKAVLSGHDSNETKALDGGLLITKYGKGYYVYTGYSWFRELPAGVPGAYRLFANIISLGSSAKTNGIQTGQLK